MPVNLSVKQVPDRLAELLRLRAAANRRSLQRELLSILEAAVGFDVARQGGSPQAVPQDSLTIEELGELSRQLFPNGTASSVEYLRQLRRSR